MYVYVVRTCIRSGKNVYLGGTKMGGSKRRWYEKPGIQKQMFAFQSFVPQPAENHSWLKSIMHCFISIYFQHSAIHKSAK